MLVSFALDGFANATEALTGHYAGKHDYTGLKKIVVLTGRWIFIVAVLFLITYSFAGQWIINTITTLPNIREISGHYLPFIIILPLLAAGGFLFDGVFIGTNQFVAMRNVMFIALSAIY
ncbi:hypothetical protein BGC07_03390 [Piscirickettsia litoralis]|uniref:MATE family efflux transporter n=2 Tax=Piscirickettsia litoralis TaxID=1891921 RepID=A0ABX2ZZX8_9GAMM|nr:hypothetical protein BGC07_03390 [Piscirickettsia litoralis]